MHRVILGAGVVIMEGLTNLGALPNDAFRSTPRSTRSKGRRRARPLLRHTLSSTSSAVVVEGALGGFRTVVRHGPL